MAKRQDFEIENIQNELGHKSQFLPADCNMLLVHCNYYDTLISGKNVETAKNLHCASAHQIF